MNIKNSISYLVSRILYRKYRNRGSGTTSGESGFYTKYEIPNTKYSARSAGFTFIETMVAITLLTVSITAPMTLAVKSLSSAYYARDQITAFHLAQEAIESVRHSRDNNVLKNALGIQTDLLEGMPPSGTPFTIDTINNDAMEACSSGTCPVLRKSGGLYGYNSAWTPTNLTRTVLARFASETNHDEIIVTVTVEWRTSSFASRRVVISENLYRWVNDGSGSTL